MATEKKKINWFAVVDWVLHLVSGLFHAKHGEDAGCDEHDNF